MKNMNIDPTLKENKSTIERKEKIRTEQIKLLFRQLKPSIIFAYITITVFIFHFKNEDIYFVLLVISTLLIISISIPYFFYRSFKKNKDNIENIIKLSRYFTINTFFTSLLWSSFFSYAYDPNDTRNAYFIIFSCVAFLVGSAPILSNYFLCYFVFASVFSLPLITIWISSPNTEHQKLGYLTLGLLLLMLTFSYWLNRTWKNSIALRFENLDLAESLQIQKNAANQANKAKSKFLAAASHDLRQPLHALSLFTAVLDESVQQPKARHVIEQINMSIRALENLFNTLLDISQLDAGVLTPKKTSVDLHNLFKRLNNDYQLQANEKNIELIFSDSHYFLFTDENLLEQILRNYISNALRYTDAGSITTHCETENETSLSIHVTDTGMGISDDEQQAIFDEFYQLENQERDRSKGLGLGLAIVKRTASLLGHPINIQSTSGEGSTFSVTVELATEQTSLPIPPDQYQAEDESTENHEDKEQTDPVAPIILVIDDELAIRQGTQSLLEAWECKVFSAASQVEALTILKQHNQVPDGIIADYSLSDQKTGVDAIFALHEEYHSGIKGLIITGDIDPKRLIEINKSGFQVLHKPVAALKLRTFIDRVQKDKRNRNHK